MQPILFSSFFVVFVILYFLPDVVCKRLDPHPVSLHTRHVPQPIVRILYGKKTEVIQSKLCNVETSTKPKSWKYIFFPRFRKKAAGCSSGDNNNETGDDKWYPGKNLRKNIRSFLYDGLPENEDYRRNSGWYPGKGIRTFLRRWKRNNESSNNTKNSVHDVSELNKFEIERNMCELDLEEINCVLEAKSPSERIRWAATQFGTDLVMTSSFGATSSCMLHLVTDIIPDVRVVTVDTGYLFPETYNFMDDLCDNLGLNLKVFQSDLSPARMEAKYGKLWEIDLEKYNKIRKVDPHRNALNQLGAKAVLSGIRKEQTTFRMTQRYVELRDGYYSVHPILDWAGEDIESYLTRNELPMHPLCESGYKSIGDVHTTRKVNNKNNERDGRLFFDERQECGIHLSPENFFGQNEDSQSNDGG